ncbi:methanogenesis marker 16 metalloprotein [Methanospirillum stamsii]|uniref:Methanogenesis marker 16 metalloprotein n=1 Tax=Methanospirillum stamsii TaxID=1277351 RepID=A0A2V2NKE1_9EURY|nr:methanogenesis marker 16 metalloprotein [Methanospirillum stamsii]PWR76081.1 methanogenesis marker 16 metalloprotein [Methanospirillum stamsii]
MRKLEEIRARIKVGDAVILTASELKKRISHEDDITDVDVVTCGTCGVMSGTYAVLSVPVAPPGTFSRAETVTLQGVPAIPGPCPNERLGLVDLMVFGTAHANERYGGGHLFHDLIAGKPIHVEVSAEGRHYDADITLGDLPFARLFTTRSAFKNYSAITNRGTESISTIFSVLPLEGPATEVTVSGCGEINPLENDPSLRFHSPGDPVVVNGVSGRIIGTGTRSTPEKPNLSVHADMKDMSPEFCGGFVTSAGPECITSIGTAIPLVDKTILQNLSVLDDEIMLPVVDIKTRQPFGTASYGQVWNNTASRIGYHPEKCLHCSPCIAHESCPAQAIREDGTINQHTCFVCGTCVRVCEGLVYEGNFGSLSVSNQSIPIVLRQSDRRKAEILCRKVRDMLNHGELLI